MNAYGLLNPNEKRAEMEKKISFSDKWEEELKQKLFEEDKKTKEAPVLTTGDVLTAKVNVHHKRPKEK